MFQPLQITAYLAGSVGASRAQDLSLDGILSARAIRQHYGEDYYALPDPKEHLAFVRLPLSMRGKPSPEVAEAETGYTLWDAATRTKDGSLWYWACSSAQIDIKARSTNRWVKRFNSDAVLSEHLDFGGKVEKIIIEQGQFKAYYMPNSVLIAEKIVWYVYGDGTQIECLLCGVSALAKKRSQGEGYVIKWTVEPLLEDCSEWQNNQLMRPIPSPLVDPEQIKWFDMQHIAFRAPQWHPLNQAMCVTRAEKREATRV